MGNENNKRSPRNLKISTRITLSTILGIIVPILIVLIIAWIFIYSMTNIYHFSAVSTDSYSMINQIQWSQTMSSISNELLSNDDDEKKVSKVDSFIQPLEKFGVMVYVERDEKQFYSSADREKIFTLAEGLHKIDGAQNINYFGDDGVLIVTHAQNEKERYLIVAVSADYSVSDVSSRRLLQEYFSVIISKTGFLIALVFILSIIALSFITSKTISKPIRELAEGTNEIANGNLDYVIDYDSTNEIGRTVDSFNHMVRRLKESLEKQSSIEQSRKEMIAGVAHDLRTPLTSVKGYVEGLRDGIANTPEKQENYLKTIYSSTLTMERLLDDLLTISRLELGSITLEPTETDLNSFLSDCAEEIGFELDKRGFDFEYVNNCETDVKVSLDVDRFSRVITNIVSNSIKYSRKDVKGKIVIEVQEYSKSVIISIADNGIGLDADSLPKIFDTFYRADKARSKTAEGSGIGLSVCRQIVELHGGRIWATGAEGEGLTIHISLNKI